MGTIVCQGLQSYLESQIAESRTLRLRLSAPKPSSESPGWGSIQTLTDPAHFLKPAPMVVKRSVSSCLSDKSLQLCTENLGSETGADQKLFFSDPHHDSNYYLFSSDQGISDEKPTESSRRPTVAVKKSRTAPRGNGFPPPLTTMRGPELIKVRPHREGGRLVMKAVKSQSPPSCFQAERIDSRLRLHVVVGHSLDTAFDYSASIVTECNDNDNNNNTNYAEENEIREEEGVGRSHHHHHHHHHQHQQHHQHENVNYVSSDESSKEGLVLNWEPFRVATALQV